MHSQPEGFEVSLACVVSGSFTAALALQMKFVLSMAHAAWHAARHTSARSQTTGCYAMSCLYHIEHPAFTET